MIRQQNVFELVTLCSATCRSARVRARSSALPQQSKQKKSAYKWMTANGNNQTSYCFILMPFFSLSSRCRFLHNTLLFYYILDGVSSNTHNRSTSHSLRQYLIGELQKKKQISNVHPYVCIFVAADSL